MQKPIHSEQEIKFEHEIGYSQNAILFNFVFGILLLLAGVGLAFWLKSWVAVYFPLIGLLLFWQAIKRIRNQEPQLKIGSQGIWTVKTGSLPWSKAQAVLKVEPSYRSAITYLIIYARGSLGGEITRMTISELDIDGRNLQAYLSRYSPK